MKAYQQFIKNVELTKSEHTARSYKSAIEPMIEYFNEEIFNLKPSDILEYRHTLQGKASTINARMRPLKVFFNFLLKDGLVEYNPVSGITAIREPKKVKAILTNEEAEAMVDAGFNRQEKLMITVMFTTGIRVHELVNLKVSDIQGRHFLVHGKGNKERKARITSLVAELLVPHLADLEKTNEMYLFPSRRGGGQVSTEAIRQRIKRIAEDAGIEPEKIENITPHTFRRSFATSMLNNGKDIAVVKEALGHTNIETTLRYAQVQTNTIDSAVEDNFKDFGQRLDK